MKIECTENFRRLHRVVEKLYPSEFTEHREAIVRIASRHLAETTKALPSADFDGVLYALNNPQLAKHESAGGAASMIDGQPVFMMAPDTLRSPYALVVAVHETQHLADFIVPSSAARAAVSRGNKIRRDELRAFTRQREFLVDVVKEIGSEGIVDLIAHNRNFSANNREALRRLVNSTIQQGPHGKLSAELEQAIDSRDVIPFSEFGDILRDLGLSTSGPTWSAIQPFFFIKNRSNYARFYLQLETYVKDFESEKRALELQKQIPNNDAKLAGLLGKGKARSEVDNDILKELEERLRKAKMKAVAATGILTAVLAAEVFRHTYDRARSVDP